MGIFKNLMTIEPLYPPRKGTDPEEMASAKGRWEKVLRDARVPKRHKNARLSVLKEPLKSHAESYISEMPGIVQRGECLVITGEPRSGKTTIGIAIMKEAMRRGASCLYLREPEIPDLLTTEGMREIIYAADVLFVDNVGSYDASMAPGSSMWRYRARDASPAEEIIADKIDYEDTVIISVNREILRRERYAKLHRLVADCGREIIILADPINSDA